MEHLNQEVYWNPYTGKATKSISGGKNRDRNAFFCVAYQ